MPIQTREIKVVPGMLESFDSLTMPGENGCVIWAGSYFNSGYGQFCVDRESLLAHRVAYTLKVGEIPDGMLVLHTCHNTRCVEIEHLIVGTHADNMAMMVAAGRSKGRGGKRKMDARRVQVLRRLRTQFGWAYARLGDYFGITAAYARAIYNRHVWLTASDR